MSTITEDYVSFETAKLLKEKGFDEHCFCINYPLPEGEHHNIILPNLLNNSMIPFIDEYKFCRYKEDFITIPTLQMAMKWLREVHNTNIDIVSVWNQKRFEYQVFVVTPENAKHCYIDDKLYLDYEQAVESAIKYSLEHLI
jgi:hypothetical protein